MSSAALTFDRLAYVDRLTNGGVDEQQARAHAAALELALGETVATKADLKDLAEDFGRHLRQVDARLTQVETRLEAKIETAIAGAKVDILRWLVVTQVALGGFLFAALKLLH